MVFVTGDIHGWLDIGKLTPDRWPQGQNLRHSDFLVICGDFGLIWSNPPSLEEKFFLDWLDVQPWTTLFVDGNHENYDLLDTLPTCKWHGGIAARIPGRANIVHLLRGEIYEMGSDGRWFTMGGAPSHDKQWREPGKSWWSRELPSPQEYDRALANLERVNWQVDYVFSHDVPRHLRRHAMSRYFDPSREQDDELSAFLQTVDERLCQKRLKMWYAGHYHDDIMLRDHRHAVLYNQIVRLGDLPDGSVHRHVPFCEESWTGVRGLGKRYREWVLSRQILGCTISWQDNEHIRLTTDAMFGEVNFIAAPPAPPATTVPATLPPADNPEVVELRVTQISDGTPAFHTRFELTDMLRAKELFLEMCEMLEETELRGILRVLLVCDAGLSTDVYQQKMLQKAVALSLRMDFHALPIDDAIASGQQYDVVLMAPQVGYRRADAARAFPHATVAEIPPEVFATLDVAATMHLLLDAAYEGMRGEDVGRELSIARPIDTTRNVMVVSVINHVHATTIGYRVFRDGGVALDGTVRKRHVDFRDIEDVLATVRVDGLDVRDLDAVGITLPGIVNRASVSLPSDTVSDYDLGRSLQRRYGIQVYVDNNSNAAAMGCYMTQTDYDSVVFHAQHGGMLACGEGLVVDGHLVKGRLNCAGQLLPMLPRLRHSDDPETLAWSSEGMRELVATYLLAPICSVAPDAVFVYAPLAGNMDELRDELAKTLPAARIPRLVRVDDHRELMFLGELALCVGKLTRPRPHRKW